MYLVLVSFVWVVFFDSWGMWYVLIWKWVYFFGVWVCCVLGGLWLFFEGLYRVAGVILIIVCVWYLDRDFR